MTRELDKIALLSKLDKIDPPETAEGADSMLRKISMTAALPALTEIDHEKEFQLCQNVAKHLLGKVPEPMDAEMG
jgi:hypothetical protein